MHIAILTFEGFNELDSLIALGILNRVKRDDWRVSIAAPAPWVTSMNGVVLQAHATLEEVHGADAVIVGSGVLTRELVQDAGLMARIRLDPERQLIGAQCSGTLMLASLGLLDGVPACTDLITKPWVQQAGVNVVNQPFIAKGNVATAGGCLPPSTFPAGSSPGLRAWKSEGRAALRRAGRRKGRIPRPRDGEHRALPPPTAVAMFA